TANLPDTGVAPAVTLAPASVAFGNQQVGSTSAAQAVTLTNTGNSALAITSIAVTGANSGDFAQTNTCPASPATLAANGTCAISVTFTPAASGARSAAVTSTDNASGSPQTANLTGTGVASAVSLAPASVAFGSPQVATTTAPPLLDALPICNSALAITSIAVTGANSGDFAQTNTCPASPATLAANGTCAISVTFTPAASGARSAAVTSTDNASGSPQTANLTGTGVASAVSLAPASVAFGSPQVATTTAPPLLDALPICNSALAITSIAVTGANSGDFAQTNTCPASPATLAANGTCAISVTFTPAASGARSAAVTSTDNASGSPQTANLTGTGVASAVSLAPASVAFGSPQVATTTAPPLLDALPICNSALAITSIAVTGANSGDFAQTNTCPASPATLAANGTCAISVTFTPAASGARSAAVTSTDNASGSPQTANLTGTGVASAVSLAPASVAFGSPQVATTTAPPLLDALPICNSALAITSIAVTGANSGDFAQTNTCPASPATLAANGTCAISVTFTPAASGARSAAVTSTDNASGSPQTANLTGTGVASAVSLAPASVAFGSPQVATTTAPPLLDALPICNSALAITSIAVTGANSGDFAQTNTCPASPATLAANGTCAISVKIGRASCRARGWAVTITENASGRQQTASLTGTGVAPAVSLAPASVAFGSQQVGTTIAAQAVTLTNTGNAALSITSIAVTGANSGDFAQTNTCPASPATLAANGTCAISV